MPPLPLPLLRPFAALRPAPDYVSEVAAPPYDVLNSAEARLQAKGKKWSFLHVSKPEIDLSPDVDPYSDAVYAKGADNFIKMIDSGVLMRDPSPCYYIYRLEMDGHSQTGLAAAASVAAYDENRIRKHELTRPDKEQDRIRHIEALNAHTGPALLAHQPNEKAARIMALATALPPNMVAAADNGVTHTLWVVSRPEWVRFLTDAFTGADALYIADGHHRSAAASRVASARRKANPNHQGGEAYQYFLAVTFSKDEMRILDYNRVVRDLNGLTVDGLLEKLSANFIITDCKARTKPAAKGQFAMYLEGRWRMLALRRPPSPSASPAARLDVSLLYDLALAPVFGVGDQRTDKRIDFVGGARGLAGLEARVDSREMAVAFALYPTSVDDLMAVASAGQIMPPKSTWFEPKLADGLLCHMI